MSLPTLSVQLTHGQWDTILGLLEEKHGQLSMVAKSLPKTSTKITRNTISDIEEIMMDIADQQVTTYEDEEE